MAVVGALVPALLLSTVGCDSATSAGEPAATTVSIPAVNPKLAEQVPQGVRASGILAIATDPNYPPMEQRRDGSLEGVDVDVASAIAGLLGLVPAFRETQFSNVIPSVAIDQYQVGISSMWADGERSQYVDMVTYLSAGKQLAVRNEAGAPQGTDLQLCGRPVAVEEGTEAIDTLALVSRACRQAGAKPVRIQASLSQTQATDLLLSGSVDAMLADAPVVSYAVAQSDGLLQVAGNPIDPRPYGIAVNQDQVPLARTVRNAVQELIDSGLYGQILENWGVSANAITESEVLPARASFADRGVEDASSET